MVSQTPVRAVKSLDRLTYRTGWNRTAALRSSRWPPARFGVTSRYLVSAKEIQIKMAQGAKPGEGGHLPGKKVYPWIAKYETFHTGSEPDLPAATSRYLFNRGSGAADLRSEKCKHDRHDISVKLVSEAGVGTVAAGVAKAGAQVILISGYDGGTGAAPRSSIHNAGLPWELGLAETHQTLIHERTAQQGP